MYIKIYLPTGFPKAKAITAKNTTTKIVRRILTFNFTLQIKFLLNFYQKTSFLLELQTDSVDANHMPKFLYIQKYLIEQKKVINNSKSDLLLKAIRK